MSALALPTCRDPSRDPGRCLSRGEHDALRAGAVQTDAGQRLTYKVATSPRDVSFSPSSSAPHARPGVRPRTTLPARGAVPASPWSVHVPASPLLSLGPWPGTARVTRTATLRRTDHSLWASPRTISAARAPGTDARGRGSAGPRTCLASRETAERTPPFHKRQMRNERPGFVSQGLRGSSGSRAVAVVLGSPRKPHAASRPGPGLWPCLGAWAGPPALDLCHSVCPGRGRPHPARAGAP